MVLLNPKPFRLFRNLSFFILGLLLILPFEPWGYCAGIVGSAHDFGSFSWSAGQLCLPCHSPHAETLSPSAIPLWNHEITTQTYTPYQSSTLNAAVGQPDGLSKLCLSCHDGTVALDAFGGLPGTPEVKVANPIGRDLNNTEQHGGLAHPISFVYDDVLASADGHLSDPATPQALLGGATIQKKLLSSNRFQCSSCHDAHNKDGYSKLLRLPLTTLCNVCHVGN